MFGGSSIGFLDPAIPPIFSCQSRHPALLYVEIPIPPNFRSVYFFTSNVLLIQAQDEMADLMSLKGFLKIE